MNGTLREKIWGVILHTSDKIGTGGDSNQEDFPMDYLFFSFPI